MHIKTSNQEKFKLGFGDYTCNWGVHICGLYETEEERDSIIMGYLNQGDRTGDLQLYCPAERTKADFKHRYSEIYPDCADHTEDCECFQLFSTKDLYYPDGFFFTGGDGYRIKHVL